VALASQNRPYKIIAAITPCPKGWLVLPGRLAGVTVTAEDAFVLGDLLDVLDYRPRFEAGALNAPTGWMPEPSGPFRAPDQAVREHLGWPRLIAVPPVPSLAALHAETPAEAAKIEPWLTRDDVRRFRWYRQAQELLQPYHQRAIVSANPELSFQVMNSDQPLTTSPFHDDGVTERLNLIRQRMPSIDDVIMRPPPDGAATYHMIQCGGLLWTARRAADRALSRLPLDPIWDDEGMRLEITR
jgi:predicted RNase H-like nuclease